VSLSWFMKNFAALAKLAFRPTADQVSTELGGEMAILNPKTGIYFGLDPVGARVWYLITEMRCMREIRDTLLNEYDVKPERLESDLLGLLSELQNKGLIEPAPPGARERTMATTGTEGI
jgi:hypothetical protein